MPATRRTTRAPSAVLVWLSCLVAVGAAACSGDPAPETPPPPPPATALADLDLADLAIERRDPCAGIAADVLTEVVGDGHDDVRTWQPGQALPGSKQVGDEYGCEVSGPEATARAWVFAPPATAGEARALVKDTVSGKCRRSSESTFGTPGVAFACGLNSGASLDGMRGLIGDAWVACEVQGNIAVDDSDPSRTERWCVAVLGSLAG